MPSAYIRRNLRRLYLLHAAAPRHEMHKQQASTRSLVVSGGLMLVAIGITLTLLLLVDGTAVAYAALTTDLPSLANVRNVAPFQTAQIFDRHGVLLWSFDDPDGGKRTVIPLNQISQNLIDATLAAEDAFFYANPGFDLRASLRSAIIDLTGSGRTGASTITQQLVRNVILSPQERTQVTITRKLREMILAYSLTQHVSKDDILQMYLNNVHFGEQSYGAEAASETYFGEHARDLDLAQAALLAGLIQSPAAYDPVRTDVPRTADGVSVLAKERQAYVLEQMAYHGFITREQAQNAYTEPLTFHPQQPVMHAPHWVMHIRDLVEQQYGVKALYQGGLKIYTTLDVGYDDLMQQVLQSAKSTIATQGANDAALIAVKPKTGEILAYQGSLDYYDDSIDGQVDVLTSQRQPGSSIKPIIYSEAFVSWQYPV